MLPDMVDQLRRCPGMLDYFDRIVSVGQDPRHDLRDWVTDGDEAQQARTYRLYRELAANLQVTHAIVSQPLMWYAEAAASALREAGVRVFWTERYFDKAILDEIGCQYTADSELARYGDAFTAMRLWERSGTREAQPPPAPPEALWAKYGPPRNVVPIFGQVPTDRALADTSGGMTYADWLYAIVAINPAVQFLFKQHPIARTELPALPNIVEVDEHVHSLIDAYPNAIASFSSTVIIEAMGRLQRAPPVVFTGGHHFMSGLTFRLRDPPQAALVTTRLQKGFALNTEYRRAVRRRLSFVEDRYTMRLDDVVTLQRLIAAPGAAFEFYAGRV